MSVQGLCFGYGAKMHTQVLAQELGISTDSTSGSGSSDDDSNNTTINKIESYLQNRKVSGHKITILPYPHHLDRDDKLCIVGIFESIGGDFGINECDKKQKKFIEKIMGIREPLELFGRRLKLMNVVLGCPCCT